MSDEPCQRCGHCCTHFSMLHFVTRDEWSRIVAYLRDKGREAVTTHRLDPATNRVVSWDDVDDACLANLERFKQEHDSSGIPGVRPSGCPFVTFDASEKVYTCEIHPVKPAICKAYTCEGRTRFGKDVEYCTTCALAGADAIHEGTGSMRPCDLGIGCPQLLERARFFVKAMSGLPANAGAIVMAPYYARLLETNLHAAMHDLEAAGMPTASVARSLAPLRVLQECVERSREATG